MVFTPPPSSYQEFFYDQVPFFPPLYCDACRWIPRSLFPRPFFSSFGDQISPLSPSLLFLASLFLHTVRKNVPFFCCASELNASSSSSPFLSVPGRFFLLDHIVKLYLSCIPRSSSRRFCRPRARSNSSSSLGPSLSGAHSPYSTFPIWRIFRVDDLSSQLQQRTTPFFVYLSFLPFSL